MRSSSESIHVDFYALPSRGNAGDESILKDAEGQAGSPAFVRTSVTIYGNAQMRSSSESSHVDFYALPSRGNAGDESILKDAEGQAGLPAFVRTSVTIYGNAQMRSSSESIHVDFYALPSRGNAGGATILKEAE